MTASTFDTARPQAQPTHTPAQPDRVPAQADRVPAQAGRLPARRHTPPAWDHTPPACGPGPWTSTVPRELVHRAAVAEVLLTDWQRHSETHYTITAQWPRGHNFYTPIAGTHHDPLIAAETIRQAGALLAHAEFDVPLGHHFLLEELTLTTNPGQMHVGHAPADLTLHITCTDITRRGRRLTALRYHTTLTREGQPAGHGRISFTVVTPAVYHRIRPAHVFTPTHQPPPLTTPLTPQTVGRHHPHDVVLSPTPHPHHYTLRTNTHHPHLFDHPQDHIPGMLLLEAARQAATATHNHNNPHPTTHHLPTHHTTHYTHYAELDHPTHIHTHPTTNPHTLHITAHQNNHTIFHTTLTTQPTT
ncbi:ScbA/BarX family gamma-butyrolactone biosynthesis protein [Streptomyces parvulus]|uniref:ScbA/BarX family gamma-butyrolactone biosynthesis protein n=1 Tax=Streptomyces parvulus TaxID=146923 RepID=UPI0036A29A89